MRPKFYINEFIREGKPFYEFMEEMERAILMEAIELSGKNIAMAAKFLRMNRTTLSQKFRNGCLKNERRPSIQET